MERKEYLEQMETILKLDLMLLKLEESIELAEI